MNPKAVIWDIDGVLVDNIGRMSSYKEVHGPGDTVNDWLPFYDSMPDDSPNDEWIAVQHCMHPSVFHVLLTCRPEITREVTIEWLHRHNVWWDELHMWNPERHGYYEHKSWHAEDIRKRYEVMLVVEDSPTHCSMFRSMGLRVMQVQKEIEDARFG
jgi:hypothetical protein